MYNRDNLKRILYPLGLIFILSLFFLLLENKYPYYFLHDDNRDQFLPYFVHNYRSLVINKEIPLYNPHQLLGVPHLSAGQTAALYPIGYISVFLSKVAWGHYFAAIDILVFIHLIIAGLGFYYFLKLLGIDDKCALFGAMTWPLSSFVIYVSSSWQNLSGLAAYFPWMIYFSLRLYKRPNHKNLMGLVVSRLLLFYIGYVQFFVLSVIFELLAFLIITFGQSVIQFNKNLIKVFRLYFLSYVYTLILSLPLLLPLWHQTTISAARSSPLYWKEFSSATYDIFQWIWGMLYPFSNTNIHPIVSMFDKYLPYLSHMGYVSLFFLIFGFVYLLRDRSKKGTLGSRVIYIYCFSFLAFLSLLWSIGHINSIIYLIPVFNRFRWSFKLGFFTNFYLIILASMGLYLYFSDIKSNKKIKNCIFLGIMLINVTSFFCIYICGPQRPFKFHSEKIPLEEPLRDKIIDGRIFSVGYKIRDQHYADGFCFDYATLWGLYHFAGYDPLIIKDNHEATFGLNYIAAYNIGRLGSRVRSYGKFEPQKRGIFIPFDYLRTWGVKWYVICKKRDGYKNYLNKNNIFPRFEDESRIVYYDKNANPLIYWRINQQIDGIDYNIKTNSINIDVENQKDDWLIINFLYNPFFKATVDNINTDIKINRHNQMVIFLPEGNHRVVLKYSDPYFVLGSYLTFFFIVVLCISYIYKRHFNKIIKRGKK